MRRLPKLLLGTLAVAAIAGTALAADRVHVLDVALPDGSVRQIRYTGDVAPRIILVPVAAISPVALPGDDSSFAMLDRLSAMMDAQAQAMLRQGAALSRAAPTMAGGGPALDRAALAAMPGGTVRYSVTSFSGGNGRSCVRSVQVLSLGAGRAPKVVRQGSGDCSAVTGQAPAAAAARAPAPAAPSPVTPARYLPAPAPHGPTPVI